MKMYSLEELAHILNLHYKTVLRFVKEGQIKANKIGRRWMVTEEDLKAYAHGELAQPASPKLGLERRPVPASVLNVSAVVEIVESNQEEASRISNTIIAMLNSKPADHDNWGNTRFDLMYNQENGNARFIFYGSTRFITFMMNFFETIVDQQ